LPSLFGARKRLEKIIDAARLANDRGEGLHFMLVGDGGERWTWRKPHAVSPGLTFR